MRKSSFDAKLVGLLGLLLAGSLTASPADVKEIDLSFARSPVSGPELDYPCPKPIVGAGGTLRFELLVPGTYTVEARKSADGRNVALSRKAIKTGGTIQFKASGGSPGNQSCPIQDEPGEVSDSNTR